MPTAILTGVTGGWGRAVLDRFVEGGWNVCATTLGVTDPSGFASDVLLVEADLTSVPAAEAAIARARGRFGAIDAMACVAGGFAMAGPIHQAPPDVLHGQLRINLETAYTMTRAVLPAMLEAGAGSIVYVASRAALHPFAGASGYIISKAALLALMRCVDVECRSDGVRANAIVPNIVDTPRNRAENPDADFSRWTTGAELARVIEWLCGPDSAPLSGGTIPAYGRA